MPQWQRLVQNYGRKGLRFIVVRDADDGRCPSLPWTPHRAFCDDDAGSLQKRFGVQSFPSAFLWNWRGELLVKDNAHVAAVKAAADRFMASSTRALVVAGRGTDKSLVPLLRDEVRRAGKIDVVSGPEDGAMFHRLRKKYSGLKYKGGDGRCHRAGQPLPPNAVLKVIVHGKRQRWLSLELHPMRGDCLLGTGKAPWQARRPARSAAEAVSDLLDRLRLPELQMPGGRRVPARAPIVEMERRGDGAAEWKPADDGLAPVSFASRPPGAMVHVDGKPICQAPCSKMLPPGRHLVAMHKPQYVSRNERTRLKSG